MAVLGSSEATDIHQAFKNTVVHELRWSRDRVRTVEFVELLIGPMSKPRELLYSKQNIRLYPFIHERMYGHLV
jgi:hypothetical protein